MNTFGYKNKKAKDYFEGWYTRFTSNDSINFAVIFAITKNKEKPHSFIQIFKENDKECTYLSFNNSEFKYDNNTVFIGKNHLSTEHLYIEHEDIKIDVAINDQKTLYDFEGSNSAMGYLSKAPLECFQEVIHLESHTSGSVTYQNIEYVVDGKGYMEKTYGTNFPSNWVWIQSNNNIDNSIISFSVGKVPVLFFNFKGFFILLKIDKKLYRFSTYNFSRINVKTNQIIIKRGRYKIILKPESTHTTKLLGPKKKGDMSLDVFESITSLLNISFTKGSKTIYEGEFSNVGLELMY